MSTTILITGINRGIGKQVTSLYLQRPNYTVIGGVRDPSSSASQELYKLPTGEGSKLILVKLDSSELGDASKAVETLQKEHGITALDVVIANAGVIGTLGSLTTVPVADLQPVLTVNTMAPIALFQAVYPLLKASKQQPAKFVGVSSILGSIASMASLMGVQSAHYNISKTALNSAMVYLHHEHPDLIIFPLHPGWVATDMGNDCATHVGMKNAPTTIEHSGSEIVSIVDKATREGSSGKLMAIDSTEPLPW